MLAIEPTDNDPCRPDDLPPVARVVLERVVPCGPEPVRRLAAVVDEKLARVRELETIAPDRFRDAWDDVLCGVVSTRPYRSRIRADTDHREVRALVREAREGQLGPNDIPDVGDRLVGAPLEVRLDVASELLHGAAPDRVALLARWVWNPSRGTGALAELGRPAGDTYTDAQARLGEVRLGVGALGYPWPTFAMVDVVLALSCAARLQQVTDGALRSGGFESLLPGAFPIATMILGVRRRVNDADR